MKSGPSSSVINELGNQLKGIISEENESLKKQAINSVRQTFKKQYQTLAKKNLSNFPNFGSNDKLVDFQENKMKAFSEIQKSFVIEDDLEFSFRNFCAKTCYELAKIRINCVHSELNESEDLKILNSEVIIKGQVETVVDKIFLLRSCPKKSLVKESLEMLEYIVCDYEDQYCDIANTIVKSVLRVATQNVFEEENWSAMEDNEKNQSLYILTWFLEKIWISSDKMLFIKEEQKELLAKRAKLESKQDVTEGVCLECVKANREIVDKLVQTLIKYQDFMQRNTMQYFMNALTKEIINKMDKPILLSDFLINIFDSSQHEDIRTAAQYNILKLMADQAQEYENFYMKIYSMLNTLNATTSSKFLKILETTLRSKSTSELTITSFVKIISRRCLFSKPKEIFWYLALLFNMIKNHENLGTYFESSLEQKDPFDMKEDLLKCKANDSKSYEMTTVEKHYLKEVVNMSAGMRRDLKEADHLDLQNFNSISYDKLIKAAIDNIGE